MKTSYLIGIVGVIVLVTILVARVAVESDSPMLVKAGAVGEAPAPTVVRERGTDGATVVSGLASRVEAKLGVTRNPKTEEGIVGLVSDFLNLPAARLSVDAPLMGTEIGADELDLVEIIMLVEDEFGIQITDDTFEDALGSDFNASQGQVSVRLLSAVAQVAPALPEG